MNCSLPSPTGQLVAALDQLVSSEIIFRRGAPPQATYSFKHALVQDAAYESMLRGRRRQLHARIAQTLCSPQRSGQAEAPLEIIAEHATRAGMYAEAARYWLEAGKRAKAAYANREAASHLDRCLSALSHHADARWRKSTALLLYLEAAPSFDAGASHWCARHSERRLHLEGQHVCRRCIPVVPRL